MKNQNVFFLPWAICNNQTENKENDPEQHSYPASRMGEVEPKQASVIGFETSENNS